MELLAPCGNYETFLAVVNNGADAVYLAGSKYGARAYADNFSDEEIIKAIKYAHLLNVKVYLTVNTLIKESEWNDVLEFIEPFYKAGLDACIVQDLGLISVFAVKFPDMECHASTQAFITSSSSLSLYHDLGVKRVVLARELSLDEIKIIKKRCSELNMEIETFIHGAMCYSYSGQCLFSSCLGGRSGNRGRCAGPCRLEYDAISSKNIKASGYLLSMKDQCTLELIPELIDINIDSLKIEGRMKKPEYAALVTSMYRKYIDLYCDNSAGFKISKQDINLLKSFYMRSEIGAGYYHINNGKELLCVDNPAYSKTSEELLEKVRTKLWNNKKTNPVSFYINIIKNNNMSVTAQYKDIYVYAEGDLVTESVKRPATKEDIIKHFAKLGDTVFSIEEIEVNLDDNSFVSVSAIKELRRKAIELLEIEILNAYKKNKAGCAVSLAQNRSQKALPEILFKVLNNEQLQAILDFDKTLSVCLDSEFYVSNINMIKNKEIDCYIDLPFVVRNRNFDYINRLLDNAGPNIKGFIVNNLEELSIIRDRFKDKTIIIGPGVYTWNKTSYKLLSECSDSIICSYELKNFENNDVYSDNDYMTIYGKVPLMQTAGCIEKTISGCNKVAGDRISYLNDRKNYKLPVVRNCKTCSNTIYNAVPTSLHEDWLQGKIKRRGFISFTDEGYDTVKDILAVFLDKKKMQFEYTKGYWKRGVE